MTRDSNNGRAHWWNHPLVKLVAVWVAFVGATWTVCIEIRVEPLKDQLSAQSAAFEEQQTTVGRLLQDLTDARAEQPSNVDQLFAVEVTLFTTKDDKDDQDVVTIEVWDGQNIVASQRAWAGVKLDNGETHSLTLAMPPKTKFTAGWQLKVRKSGTDGWIFHVAASGTFGDGQKVELLSKSDEQHFEDDPDSVATFPLRR